MLIPSGVMENLVGQKKKKKGQFYNKVLHLTVMNFILLEYPHNNNSGIMFIFHTRVGG